MYVKTIPKTAWVIIGSDTMALQYLLRITQIDQFAKGDGNPGTRIALTAKIEQVVMKKWGQKIE